MSEFSSVTAVELLLEALERGQYPFLSVASDSMAPLFRQGDQIQLGPIKLDSLAVGDVIVLCSQDDLLAHRYWGKVGLEGALLVTRGDRLAYYDPPLPIKQLKAIVIGRQRSGRLLDLRNGTGSWLNRLLTQISALEARVIGLEWPAADQRTDRQARPDLVRRLLRRLLATTATLFAGLADLIP
jgi:hypothetical protein